MDTIHHITKKRDVRETQPKSKPATEVKDENTLTSLGLTSRQARIYLALLNAGYAEAKAIAQKRNRP